MTCGQEWPGLHFFSPGSFIRMALPAFNGGKVLDASVVLPALQSFPSGKVTCCGLSVTVYLGECGCVDPSVFELVRY